MTPLADNCSTLSDCSFEVEIVLAIVAIVLVLALFAMLGPTLGLAVRGAFALGRSGGLGTWLRGLPSRAIASVRGLWTNLVSRWTAMRRLPRGVRVRIPHEVVNKIPKDWAKGELTKKHGGVRWFEDLVDKSRGGVRIDPASPTSQYPWQRVDHVIVRYGGKVRGRDGLPIRGSIKQDGENAHIPLSVYRTWRTWYAP